MLVGSAKVESDQGRSTRGRPKPSSRENLSRHLQADYTIQPRIHLNGRRMEQLTQINARLRVRMVCWACISPKKVHYGYPLSISS
jgi:hypothetical protein